VSRSEETIRIPGLWAVIAALATLVAIGLLVFLRRYRGADRTALTLSLLAGAGACLVIALAWFQCRFRGEQMTRRDLWGIGLRWGAIAGVCTSGVSVTLLAVRWAVDEQASVVGGQFGQAFLRALGTLGIEMAVSFPAYLAVGAVVGALTGLAVAEAIGVSARREPPAEPPGVADDQAVHALADGGVRSRDRSAETSGSDD
jgi:hypothetical protein